MIKLIRVTVAFLAPLISLTAFSYGADISSNLSVNVVSAGQPQPPPQASAVGFTTLARNDDFTQTQPSNWLNCNYNTNAASWFLWRFFFSNTTYSSNTNVGCNAWPQVTDPVYGGTVLDSVWRGSWAQGEPHDWTLIATAPDGNAGSTNAVEYPMGYYEFEARSDYDNGDPMGWSDWSQSVDGNPALELDFLQAAGTNGCNAWVLVWPGPQISQPVGWCNAQYHKYGVLWTGNANIFNFCFYVDDNQQGCSSFTPPAGLEAHRIFLIIWQQGTCNGAAIADATCVGDRHLYTKTVRVWSCSSWQGVGASHMCYTQ